MLIKIRNYEAGIHDFEFVEEAEKLGLKKPFIGKVILNSKMDKSNHQVLFECELEAETEFECDRCRERFDAILENSFDLVYIFTEEDKPDDEDENVFYIDPETDKIDITKQIIEYCRLSVPMKILCDDDCEGLCSSCGKNLNNEKCNCETEKVNSVWEPLLKLKDKLN